MPSTGAMHNNILWDAFAYTKTTGINELQGAFADTVKKQTLVTLDVVISRTYTQVDLEGFLISRVQLNINSAKTKRKVLPVLIYKEIEDIALNTARKLKFIAFDIRKVTKTKGAFTSDQALLKLVYLAFKDLSGKWTMPMHNWGLTMSQLYIKFGDRLKAFGDFFLGGGFFSLHLGRSDVDTVQLTLPH